MSLLKKLTLLLLSVSIFTACQQAAPEAETQTETTAPTAETYEKPRVPDWHKNATIYEVNVRHYTPEGTFAAFSKHLPRLKDMGIDILWFMPLHPISKKNRKGGMGSPYAVADYRDTNPDYGTKEDFKKMVEAIHAQGMYCIIDWVPNHTGWDNPWITEHPEWYTQDKDGNIIDPIDYNTGESWGWTDVADLNYDVPEMRLGMIDAMKYWVTDMNADGFRVDVAHGVPVDFWAQATDSLYAVKPLFMLAEAEVPAIVNNGAFVTDYGWDMHHLLNEVAETQKASRLPGKKSSLGEISEKEKAPGAPKTLADIDALLAKKDSIYRKGYQMHFTSNHDENSWSGTEFQRFGDAHLAFAVLTATFDGMPLIYTGQEAAVDKQFEFFEKDEVPWGEFKYHDFYKTLFSLKHRNQALWNGVHGGNFTKIATGKDDNIYAFMREKDGDRVVVVINFSAQKQAFILGGDAVAGKYTDVFAGTERELTAGGGMTLEPWAYTVFSGK